jgi:uncharacterized protein
MLKKMSIAIFIALTLLLAYMLIEPYLIETKEVVVESSQIPAEFDDKRIVFLSDIHYGPFFDQLRLDNLVDQVNTLNPDLILLGGDYVDGGSEYINPVFKSLSRLKAPLGVYAVLGNSDPQYLTLKTIKTSGISYIGNKGIWIKQNGSKIRLGGVGDFNNGNQFQRATTATVNTNDFVILLTHNPDYFPEVDKSKIDVVLSGHTHGGQVTFFGLWAPVVRSIYGQRYRTGIIMEDNTTLIVSNGIGTSVLPVRFFTRPQIIVLRLKKKN